MYKLITSKVFNNHTFGTNWVFNKYTTHYVFASLFKEHIIKNIYKQPQGLWMIFYFLQL